MSDVSIRYIDCRNAVYRHATRRQHLVARVGRGAGGRLGTLAPLGTLGGVSFRPDEAWPRPGSGLPGQIDYRLARRAVIADYRRGRVGRNEICDAHPELLRAARNVGTSAAQECPICEQAGLVHVSYVFGDRLKAANGRCITSQAELASLAAKVDELACYVVEVCPECAWNHLARAFVVGRRHRH
jgi:hypothetical protein